jgi:hypothetical protein
MTTWLRGYGTYRRATYPQPVPDPYWQSFNELRGVFLELSPILGIEVSRSRLVFRLTLLLTPTHPAYRPPEPGQDHRWRSGRLTISADLLDYRPNDTDPTVALGSIETWTVDSNGWSELEGPWGRARVLSPSVRLRLAEPGDGLVRRP